MAFKVTVGVSSVTILAIPAGVKRAWFKNTSTNGCVIYLSTSSPAKLYNGVRLNPNGGKWETTVGGNTIYAIGTVASGTIAGDNL